MAQNQQTPPANFEAALAEIERILHEIESGEVGLEQSLLKYERGNFLIHYCRGVLSTAEKQIEQLHKAGDGSLETAPRSPAAAKPSDDDVPF
jgi:exodeoxyribonuclease VII small subunit